MSSHYVLYASIRCGVDEIEAITRKAENIATKHGGVRYGSGFGFGNRDIDWGFTDQQSAIAARDDLRVVFPISRFDLEIAEKE